MEHSLNSGCGESLLAGGSRSSWNDFNDIEPHSFRQGPVHSTETYASAKNHVRLCIWFSTKL